MISLIFLYFPTPFKNEYITSILRYLSILILSSILTWSVSTSVLFELLDNLPIVSLIFCFNSFDVIY